MSSMQCIFYDKTLEKVVPCILIPNQIYDVKTDFDRKFYCHVKYDESRFTEYNTNKEELVRYSSEFVYIHDLYPTTNQNEVNYASACIPTSIASNHYENELNRYEKIINMITDIEGDLDRDTFYNLAEFVSYELLFTVCDLNERIFMQTLSNTQLTSQPDPLLVPQMVRMTRRIFDKYSDNDEYTLYKIHNYRNFAEFSYIDFPIVINIDNLDYNVHYIDV